VFSLFAEKTNRSLLLESSANLVALLACASVAGRLVVAFLSDALAKRLARSWLIIPCAVLMSFSLCLFALVQTQPLLYVTSSLVGAAYGMTYVLITTVTSLWFGTKFFATNNGIMGIGEIFWFLFSMSLPTVQEPPSSCLDLDCSMVSSMGRMLMRRIAALVQHVSWQLVWLRLRPRFARFL
jgi:MFS family permease